MSLGLELRAALYAIDRVLRRRRRARRERRAYGVKTAPSAPAAPRTVAVPGLDEADEPFPLPELAAGLTEDDEQRYLRELLREPEVRMFAGQEGQLIVERRARRAW